MPTVNYERLDWEDYPSEDTPLNAENLNRMEEGIAGLYADFTNLEDLATEAAQKVNTMVGAPLIAHMASEMTDHTRVYVYMGSEAGYVNGNWYYWDGTLWQSGGVYNSTAINTDKTLTVEGMAADSKATGVKIKKMEEEILSVLPESTYPFLTAGQLLSTHETTDNTPYNFRTVEQESTLEYGEIVGGTVAWNQKRADTVQSLINTDGITTSYDSSTHLFCIENISRSTPYNTGSTRGTIGYEGDLVAGHKLIVISDKTDPGVGITGGVSSSFFIPLNGIGTIPETITTTYIDLRVTSNYDFVHLHPIGDKFYFTMNVIDLTQMLGTTPADYIYGLESATAGAGVAWLKKHFPKIFQYHAYDAGSLVSVEGVSHHVTTGRNLLKPNQSSETKFGLTITINSDGSIVANGTATSGNFKNIFYAADDLMDLKNGTSYIFSTDNANMGVGAYEYVGSLSRFSNTDNRHVTFTLSPDATGILLRLEWASGVTFNNTIIGAMVRVASVTDETYTPYVSHTYPLDSTKTFRGIFKLDSSNRLYADGDRYLPDGTVQRRYGIVTLNGTETWTAYTVSGTQWFYANVLTGVKSGGWWDHINAVTERYVYITTISSSGDLAEVTGDKVAAIQSNSFQRIWIKDTVIATVDAFKSALASNPIDVVYELATPTTESADPYTNPQIVAPGGTEEYVSTSVVPVGHESRYPDDLRTKLDDLPRNLSMIAPIESGNTASQAYAVGKYFMHNNQFCKAKTAIASGATLTLNTNYEVTTVAAELYSALH